MKEIYFELAQFVVNHTPSIGAKLLSHILKSNELERNKKYENRSEKKIGT